MSHTLSTRSRVLLSFLTLLTGFVLVGSSAQAQTFAQVPSLSFTKTFGGLNPLPQNVTVASAGAVFSFFATSTTSTGGAWLSVSLAGSGCCYSTPRVMTASVNAAPALAVGTYTGQIVVTSSGGATSMTIPVTLHVTLGVPSFDNLPGALSFSLKTGRSTLTSQQIQVRNAGTGTLNWTLAKSTADGGNWLTVSSSNGAAPSVITIGITAGSLPGGGNVAGTYVGHLTLQGSGNAVTIPVSVVVGENILSQVSGISFNKTFGGADPLPQNITIASTGTPLSVSFSSFTGTGGDWLSVSLAGTGCCYATPRVISADINASPTLPVGTYTGEIVVYTSGSINALTIPVTLTVLPSSQPLFDNLPGQMSFSLKTGNTVLPSQEVQVRLPISAIHG